ncbi:ABC transporter ATP-binding protein [Lacticaseibacillus songhuajiangensis]|jgi:ATP-binding cassette subfamily B multidrug efflux pump|uniref:ABC transporter ATP-binding protein n=1 Tax=Lacticaseibacillus songhuajiangensis TaxID=1296539 RepID=UPI000F778BA9|nr:ABC transporter ATP-binding protein [Lacticaseibacillus songhuajiangensis]
MKNFKQAGRFYWQYLHVYPWQGLGMLVFVILFTVTYELAPTYLANTVQDLTAVVKTGATLDKFYGDLSIMVLLYVLSAIGDSATSFFMSWVGGKATGEMRTGMFNKMQDMRVQYFDSHSDGDILARYTSDLDNIFNAMNEAFVQVIYSIAQLIGVLVVMLRMNVPLAFVTLATTPLALIIAVVNIRSASKAVDHQQEEVGKLNGYINEQITGQKIIITNGLQADSIAGFEQQNEKVRAASLRGQILAGILQPLMNGMMLLTTAVVIFFGSWLVLRGNMATGAALALVVVYVQFAQNYFQPLVAVTSLYNQLQLAITGARRVSEVHDEPNELRPVNGKQVSAVDDAVRIEDVHFSYNPGTEILHGVSMSAARGEMVALVGPTGSGKTTIMNLLNRFYDVDSGRITIDGTDVREIDLDSLRHLVGIVLQDPQLFTGTIRENIAFGEPDAPLDAVRAAAKQANIDDFIMSLPQGYDTPISDEQAQLSAGQKQLLSIARTILTNPQVLIMDEATSNVDTVTEAKIQAAMDNVIAGRTSFVIAHRLKTVLGADKIDVLRDGRIIEEGTHAQLLAEKGFYAGLYRNQMVFDAKH